MLIPKGPPAIYATHYFSLCSRIHACRHVQKIILLRKNINSTGENCVCARWILRYENTLVPQMPTEIIKDANARACNSSANFERTNANIPSSTSVNSGHHVSLRCLVWLPAGEWLALLYLSLACYTNVFIMLILVSSSLRLHFKTVCWNPKFYLTNTKTTPSFSMMN